MDLELALAARDRGDEHTIEAFVRATQVDVWRPWTWRPLRRRARQQVRVPNRLPVVPRTALARSARVVGVLGIATALSAIGGPASAHAVLERSSPGPGSVVTTAPSQVVLTFDEAVTLLPTSVRVFAPDGSRADSGVVTHASGDSATAAVGLTATEHGSYLVSWRVVSDDSHPVSGAYTFSVGRSSTAPAASELANSPPVAGLLGAARWMSYAGSALLLGGLAFSLLCRSDTLPRARRLLLGGAAGLAVGALLSLLAKGALDAGLGLGAVGRPSLVREVLGTTFGRATLARLVLAGLGAGVVLLGSVRARAVATVGLAVGMALSFAAAGHAVAADHRLLAMTSESLHVLAASVWLGGLVLLVVTIRETGAPVAVVRRFSRVAAGCVAVLVGTGIYQAWRQVGAWGALTATTYGKELLAKLAIVAVVVACAAGSRWWLWRCLHPPTVVQAATTLAPAHEPPAAVPAPGRLLRTVAAELVLLLAVLGVTSALAATEPAATAYHPTVASNLTIEGVRVQVSAVPHGDRTMDLHLYLFGPDQQPTDPEQITATVSLPSKDIGPLPVRLLTAGPGHRTGTISVPIPGRWQLAVTVRTTAIDEATKYVDLPIR